MIVKIKQILELSQRYSKIRVFMIVKASQKEESLSKLEDIKSQLLNKCYIEEEISSSRFEEKAEEEEEEEEQNTGKQTSSYSFVVRAREQNSSAKQVEEKKGPDAATINFLRKYYSQEDGEMMDLKSAGMFIVDEGEDIKVVDSK